MIGGMRYFLKPSTSMKMLDFKRLSVILYLMMKANGTVYRLQLWGG
jgi:hypothetical protein